MFYLYSLTCEYTGEQLMPCSHWSYSEMYVFFLCTRHLLSRKKVCLTQKNKQQKINFDTRSLLRKENEFSLVDNLNNHVSTEDKSRLITGFNYVF